MQLVGYSSLVARNVRTLVGISPFRNLSPRLLSTVNEVANLEEQDVRVPHVPVMLDEVMKMLNPQPGQTIVDMTCGSGGHTTKLLDSVPDLRVFGLDRDPLAFEYGKKLGDKFPGRFFPLMGRFSELPELLFSHGVEEVDGMLFDLGCSSMQFDTPERGFALSQDGPLDMRMDGDRFPDQPTAADVLEHIEEDDLVRILRVYGDEKQAKKIARNIIEARYLMPRLDTTSQLASLVASCLQKDTRVDKLDRPAHSATKTFQAIRIFVNNEINELNRGIEIAAHVIKKNGTLVTISFHSIEDRVVKRHIVGIDMDEPVSHTMSQKYRNALSWHTKDEIATIFTKTWTPVNKHVMVPTFEEVQQNPRSRSAKLRCAIRN